MEKKELVKKFKILIDDLLDNYDKYTDEEKDQIQEIFRKTTDLNKILDKYDIEMEFSWDEYLTTVCRYFAGN